jgi:hypothetical protein
MAAAALRNASLVPNQSLVISYLSLPVRGAVLATSINLVSKKFRLGKVFSGSPTCAAAVSAASAKRKHPSGMRCSTSSTSLLLPPRSALAWIASTCSTSVYFLTWHTVI